MPLVTPGILGSNIIQFSISFAISWRGENGTGSTRRIAWGDILSGSVKVADGPVFDLDIGFISQFASADGPITTKSQVL